MSDLRTFREAIREHRRAVGRTQQQLARSIGLHPDVLSHKLHGRDNALLTTPDVIGIATTLAGWGALVTRADVYALLDLMDVPPHAMPAVAWSEGPLATLRPDDDGIEVRQAAPGPAANTRAPVPLDEPATPRLRVTPAPLPAPATPLIGRECERAEAAAAVAVSRLVTLTGVGGTGKTRLALQVAHDLAGTFGDGVVFIDLAPVRDPALLATTVARALGLAPASAEAAEAHLAEALRDREVLLVADNLEHLLDETQLLARILAVAPALHLLATSRIPLRLYGEHTIRVPPLHLPDQGVTGTATADSEAVRLFIARARAVRSDFAPDADALAAVGEICVALDGLPLAIELAAARIGLYSPQALLPLLRSRLALLTGGPRDLPRRQQTLRAALDWSHALLAPDAQQLLARLGVFAGPFDAAAAAAVSAEADPAWTLEQLADLADQSLLEVTAGETPGFRMLQTVREYALARLAETGEQDIVRRRHLTHFLTVALTAREGLDGPRQAELLDRLEQAYPNLRAALEFAWQQAEDDNVCLGEGLRLAAALNLLWQRRGPLAEGVLHLDRLLARDDAQQRPAPPQIRASAVLAACAMACFKGDYARTAELARHGIELCAPLGDHQGLAMAHRFLGEVALGVGDHAAAEPHFERELAEASLADNVSWQAHAYNMLAQTARLQGEFRRASSLLWQALKLFRAAGEPDGVSVILSSLGEVARDAGRPVQARRLFGAALRRHAVVWNKRHMAYELEGFAAAAGMEHAGRQALVYLGAAQVLREETGGPLPRVEQAILDRILAPAVAALPVRERQEALSQGRNQPLSATIAHALSQVPALRRHQPKRTGKHSWGGELGSLPRDCGLDPAESGSMRTEQLSRERRKSAMSTQIDTPSQATTGLSRSRRRRWVLAGGVAVAVAVAAVIVATTVNVGNISIISGWFPVFLFWVTIAVCAIAVVLRRDVLKEFAIGIPIGIAFVVLLFVGLHLTQAIPNGAPQSMYVWLIVTCLVAGLVAAGWSRAHWARRIAGLVAIVLAVVSAGSAANETFDYYPTFDRLLGQNANHFLDNAQLTAMRREAVKSGKLPDHGATLEVPIPGTNLRITPRPAYVWVPPAWFGRAEPKLPVIILMHGVPGQPSDWTRASYADATSLAFAEQHHGVAPILVMPDINGSLDGDSECVNSGAFGQVETYLSKTVPAFMRKNFNASTAPGSIAMAGLSEGGMCATTMALNNSKEIPVFANYSGDEGPIYQSDNQQQTIQALFGGSVANYDAHNPPYLLTHQRFAGLSGWFEAGAQDATSLRAALALQPLASNAGIDTCIATPPGQHNFAFWTQAFRDSLPWLSWKLKLTPQPASVPAHCVAGKS